MDTIEKGPAILSTCVKRWRFFLHAKLAFCYKIVRKSVRAAFFGKESKQKAVYELFFILSPRQRILTLLRKR